jgi:hypothetical protein
MDEEHDHRPTRCTATCADGSPCRAWAVHGTEPPRCGPHGGGRAPVGAPRGNQNARTHGFYARAEHARTEQARPEPSAEGWTIDTLIADYSARHGDLSRYIGQLLADDHVDREELSRLLTLYGKSASRLRRLLEERHTQRAVSERLRAIILGLKSQALQQDNADPEAER